jgi:hypothetical protein
MNNRNERVLSDQSTVQKRKKNHAVLGKETKIFSSKIFCLFSISVLDCQFILIFVLNSRVRISFHCGSIVGSYHCRIVPHFLEALCILMCLLTVVFQRLHNKNSNVIYTASCPSSVNILLA